MRAQQLIMCAAVFAMLSVLIGAFASHGLKAHLSEKELSWVSTGATYQMYHALALLAVGMLSFKLDKSKWLTISGYCFILGILLFCGSLYALAAGAGSSVVYLTPLGGLVFIGGWCGLMFAAGGIKAPSKD